MRTVRVGTIVWGVVLLVFAAAAFSVAVFDLREFQSQAVLWVVTGLGGVLVLAAIVALIARAASGGAAESVPAPEVSTGSTTEAGPTTEGGSTTRKPAAKKGQPVD